jgi:hypothetical protein
MGPVFAADFFEARGSDQTLFLVAHHLCVDMVSWRLIVQDLHDILESGSPSSNKPLSFQTWCALITENTKQGHEMHRLPFDGVPTDTDYWGLGNVSNTYGDIAHESFILDEGITTSAMGDCHNALRTEPLDILITAIVHSFHRVFPDRNLPTLFNEGHGREPLESNIDPSQTVGWFTTLCPLQVTLESGKR